MIVCKVVAFAGICAAIWLTIRFLMVTDDQQAGVVAPVGERPSEFKRIFATPEPTPEPAPKFGP